MKIGLTYTGDQRKHKFYVDWLMGNEQMEIIKLSDEENNYDAIKSCDALVLSGGTDVNPEFTGHPLDYPNRPDVWEPKRDVFEKSLFEFALQHSLPILGICRGLQLVNVLQNGKLINDLNHFNEKHNKVENIDKEHTVKIIENSLLHEIVKVKEGAVNSAHHQAIEVLGKDLMINSLADDGTIEGLEWEDKNRKPVMLCIQWHPERMFQSLNSPFAINVRNWFIEETRKSIAAKR
ncbi:MAG: gamma-glutamyl-gamma-aminobutyrate hydrolase family protein [Chitinophagaceae bacterium]